MLNLLLLNQAAQDFEITKSRFETLMTDDRHPRQSRGSSKVCPLLHGTGELAGRAGFSASMAHYGCQDG
jgi:hypothetical protein